MNSLLRILGLCNEKQLPDEAVKEFKKLKEEIRNSTGVKRDELINRYAQLVERYKTQGYETAGPEAELRGYKKYDRNI